MPDAPLSIFIGYSRTDSAFVDRLEADLKVRNFDTWVDRRKLEGGQNWRDELQKAIERCQVLLLEAVREGSRPGIMPHSIRALSKGGKLSRTLPDRLSGLALTSLPAFHRPILEGPPPCFVLRFQPAPEPE